MTAPSSKEPTRGGGEDFSAARDLSPADRRSDLAIPGNDGASEGLQQRVRVWMTEAFGPVIPWDRTERNFRFVEEALELAQANGATAAEVGQLVEYVFGRPVGEIGQEVGGVMVTLAALCNTHDIDVTAMFRREVERIEQPAVMAKIRAKQAAKPEGVRAALPGYSPTAEPTHKGGRTDAGKSPGSTS